ncbi:toxin C-terminal domain-containing protein [Sporosarcina psychrophila]|uniref:toxin C-terminal domain-containing protein n=1 Tax=Sporosarcina psychrophila TaxID=1476 RepID=UPI001E49001B|nr:toxin C-terminal domain-containing protein [Sporosarcina psychrophila]
MKKVITLLSLLVLFSTTILVPLASAKEREVLTSTDLNRLEESPQSELTEYDLKVLEIIKELESSDEGVLSEDYQGDDIYTVYGGTIAAGKYVIPGIGTVMVLITGAVIIGDVMWEATTSVAKNIINLLFSKNDPVYKTDKEAEAAAKKLGYKKISEKCGKAAIFDKVKKSTKGPGFISRDIDNHSGKAAWKGGTSPQNLCSKDRRSGTYDTKLDRVAD